MRDVLCRLDKVWTRDAVSLQSHTERAFESLIGKCSDGDANSDYTNFLLKRHYFLDRKVPQI